jgi:hypothetical protein
MVQRLARVLLTDVSDVDRLTIGLRRLKLHVPRQVRTHEPHARLQGELLASARLNAADQASSRLVICVNVNSLCPLIIDDGDAIARALHFSRDDRGTLPACDRQRTDQDTRGGSQWSSEAKFFCFGNL